MKVSEMKKLVKKAGCYKIEEGTRHEKWFSPTTGKTFLIPRHNAQELKKGTAEGIKKDAGLK